MMRHRTWRRMSMAVLAVAMGLLVFVFVYGEAERRGALPDAGAGASPSALGPSHETIAVIAPVPDGSSSPPVAQAAGSTWRSDAGLAGAQAVSALRPLAEAGKAEAMSRMAQHLLNCAKWTSTSDETFQQIELSNFRSEFNRNPEGEEEIGKVAADTERDIRYRDDCRTIDAGLVADRIDWLERAARAGDETARRDYARWGLQDFPGREDILMNFEEVQRRRELARDFLLQSVAAGDCKALYPLAEAYAGVIGTFDWILAPNPVRSWVYGSLAMQRQVLGADERTLVAARNAAFESRFDAAQRDIAQRLLQSLPACRP